MAVGRTRAARAWAAAATRARWQVAGLGVLVFVPTAIYAVQVRNFTVIPDELGYVKQSLHIAHTGWFTTPSGSFYYSAAQLLPLISAPVFALFPMSQAFVAAHVVYSLLLASTVVPAYLLARSIDLDHRSSLACAALCTITPWVTFAGTFMSEVAAFPVFMWALLAMQRALASPSPRRDALAVLAILVAGFARLNLLVLLPTFVFAVVLREAFAGDVSRRAIRERVLRQHRLVWWLLAVGVLSAAGLAIGGVGGGFTGIYRSSISAGSFNGSALRSGIDHLAFVALAAGGVPLALAIAWAIESLRAPVTPARRAYASILVVLLPAMTLVTGLFGGRHLFGVQTVTARYLFYVGPAIAVGFIAYLVERRRGWAPVAAGTVVVVALTLAVQPSALGSAVDAPAVAGNHLSGAELGKALGLGKFDPRPELAAVIVAATAAALLLVRRLPSPRGLMLVALAALLLGAGTAGYRMRSIVREADRTALPGDRSWIDHAVDGSGRVAVVLGPRGEDETRSGDAWTSDTFWNGSVDLQVVPWGGFDYNQVFRKFARFDTDAGQIVFDHPDPWIVVPANPVRWAPADGAVAVHDGAALMRSSGPGPIDMAWAFVGLNDDGLRQAGFSQVEFRLYSHGTHIRAERATFTITGRARQPVSFGQLHVRLPALGRTQVTIGLAPPPPRRGYSQLIIHLPIGARIAHVRLSRE